MLASQGGRLFKKMNLYSTNSIISSFFIRHHFSIRSFHNSKVSLFNQPPAVRGRVEVVPQPKWTLNSRVREILVETPKLNDFLRNNVGGRGVVDSNENVTMEAFIIEPDTYIQGKKLRDHIIALPAYKKIKEDMGILREVANNLEKAGVYYLHQWDKFKYKKRIPFMARGKLDGALNIAKEKGFVSQDATPLVIEGVYESVYNATWHYVQGVGGRGFGMRVKKGHPPQPWTDGEVLCCPILPFSEKSEDGRLEMMVLTSEKGWPCTEFSMRRSCDIYVNREVMRVWHKILKNLDECFGKRVHAGKELIPYVLIGTPGIGKSFAAGSFLLYQLLHYNAKELPVIAYFIRGGAYLFENDSEGGKVTWYENEEMAVSVVENFFKQGKENKEKRGYIIYDVDEESRGPPKRLPPSGWGMIVITPPNAEKYKGWKNQKGAEWIVLDCPFLIDIKAMCTWEKRNQSDEFEYYWEKIKERVNDIGPLPRYIFDGNAYEERCSEVESALRGISKSNVSEYEKIMKLKGEWNDQSPSHKLLKICRQIDEDDRDNMKIRTITDELFDAIITHVGRFYQTPDPTSRHFFRGASDLGLFEEVGAMALLNGDFVAALAARMKIIQPPGGREGQPSVLQGRWSAPYPHTGYLFFPMDNKEGKREIEINKLYFHSHEFPLVKGFYIVIPPRGRTRLIGIRSVTAESREITAIAVADFKKQLESSFSGWAGVADIITWEIIFFHPQGGRQDGKWQKCTLSKSGKYSHEQQNDIIKFWNEKVNQYRVN
ncbi:retrotransposon hot spot (RHS) protein [Trypanosoma theileri]|uniref:Retrotransposon hot spot (RHS) protein n=1 Tax=Trypanosoma theileri TaxID=67003 RepID=A0A1X0NJ11_9TRYP|nr:retrotransposon hot spot (RHS) protein [Trypanosoma theileri]ORC84453.1 retrotransposon hot spot (RHS) protein [Trypanosoma theileri]